MASPVNSQPYPTIVVDFEPKLYFSSNVEFLVEGHDFQPKKLIGSAENLMKTTRFTVILPHQTQTIKIFYGGFQVIEGCVGPHSRLSVTSYNSTLAGNFWNIQESITLDATK